MRTQPVWAVRLHWQDERFRDNHILWPVVGCGCTWRAAKMTVVWFFLSEECTIVAAFVHTYIQSTSLAAKHSSTFTRKQDKTLKTHYIHIVSLTSSIKHKTNKQTNNDLVYSIRYTLEISDRQTNRRMLLGSTSHSSYSFMVWFITLLKLQK